MLHLINILIVLFMVSSVFAASTTPISEVPVASFPAGLARVSDYDNDDDNIVEQIAPAPYTGDPTGVLSAIAMGQILLDHSNATAANWRIYIALETGTDGWVTIDYLLNKYFVTDAEISTLSNLETFLGSVDIIDDGELVTALEAYTPESELNFIADDDNDGRLDKSKLPTDVVYDADMASYVDNDSIIRDTDNDGYVDNDNVPTWVPDNDTVNELIASKDNLPKFMIVPQPETQPTAGIPISGKLVSGGTIASINITTNTDVTTTIVIAKMDSDGTDLTTINSFSLSGVREITDTTLSSNTVAAGQLLIFNPDGTDYDWAAVSIEWE